jgi:hypothetical protein
MVLCISSSSDCDSQYSHGKDIVCTSQVKECFHGASNTNDDPNSVARNVLFRFPDGTVSVKRSSGACLGFVVSFPYRCFLFFTLDSFVSLDCVHSTGMCESCHCQECEASSGAKIYQNIRT